VAPGQPGAQAEDGIYSRGLYTEPGARIEKAVGQPSIIHGALLSSTDTRESQEHLRSRVTLLILLFLLLLPGL